MKTKQVSCNPNPHVVDEKVRIANEYIKGLDMGQLHKTIEQAKAITSK